MRHIVNNYAELEASIVSQLSFQSQHPGTSGGFREEIWKAMFEQLIPKKFSIARSVFIIDSAGRVSNEVDLAIYDEQYTPYIFRHGTLKYIPIEAVAVVVECKSKSPDFGALENWLNGIRGLKTSQRAVARMNPYVFFGDDLQEKKHTQTSTRPLRILCHTSESELKIPDGFDMIIHPKGKRLTVALTSAQQNLEYWYNELNHNDKEQEAYRKAFNWPKPKNSEKINVEQTAATEIEDIKKQYDLQNYRVCVNLDSKSGEKEEISLLSLTFQLNQLLMLINNPMLFPHKAYVDMFNERYTKE
ncbi:hypothetical protein GNQ08_24945 [Paenibacillus macerans]|uniref:DUF6602 domain-containing protein n=1 Tax=Paenibacillus macerans TaxID=44252 RepID=A0A6N8F596_PAEMA|nr:hypothetical protein [Paenibacillus macerans]MUG25612.1 hypothetical protein [Paenibacillus macerans]